MSGTPEIERPSEGQVEHPVVADNQEELLYQKQEKEALEQAKELLKQIAADDAAAASTSPQPTAQVQSGQGSTKTVTVPADDSVTLTAASKGNTTNSLTWWAAYWLRMLKKALLYGWSVVYAKLSPSKK